MRTDRNGESAAHFFDQLRALSAKTICNISTSAECKILVEGTHCHFLLEFVHGTMVPVGKQLRFWMPRNWETARNKVMTVHNALQSEDRTRNEQCLSIIVQTFNW